MFRTAQFRRAQSNRVAKQRSYRTRRENIARKKVAKRRGLAFVPVKQAQANRRPMQEEIGYPSVAGRRRRVSGRVNFTDLQERVRVAADYLNYARGIALPWNIQDDWPEGELSESIVHVYLRYAGWLHTVARADAAELREVIQLLKLKSRWSDDLTKLVGKWSSPYALERWLRSTKWRANQILAPYGVKVKNHALYHLAEHYPKARIGKAAFAAAAETLRVYVCDYTLRKREVFLRARGLARAFSANRHVYKAAKTLVMNGAVKDFRDAVLLLETKFSVSTIDGVEGLVAKKTHQVRGITVQRLITCNRREAEFGWLVTSPQGETYHSGRQKRRDAVRQAVHGWRWQRRYNRYNAANLAAAMAQHGLNADEICILVRIEDSVEAGNCAIGTEAWMEKQQLQGRRLMGAPLLTKYWQDPMVRRVIIQAIRRVAMMP